MKHFERTVFRSPDYQGESGYDLVQYEIEHKDGKTSTILAYLDRPELIATRKCGFSRFARSCGAGAGRGLR